MTPIQVVSVNDARARFAPGLMHEWRLVRVGLAWMRWTAGILVVVAAMCALLATVADRSDQAGFLIIFGGVHLMLAVPQVVGLLLCCGAPEGTETRRQARLTALLVLAAVVLIVALVIVVVLHRWNPLRNLFDSDTLLVVLGIGLLSLHVNVLFIGVAWLGVPVAMGRDLGDPVLSGFADVLIAVWWSFWVVTGMLLAIYQYTALDLPHGFDTSSWAAIALTVVEVLYLRLLGESCRTLRTSQPRLSMRPDDSSPRGPYSCKVEAVATHVDTRIQP